MTRQIYKKILCLILSAFIFWSHTISTYAQEIASLPNFIKPFQKPPTSKSYPTDHTPKTIKRPSKSQIDYLISLVPTKSARVEERAEFESSGSPIIIIQDVHLNSEAQINIADTIKPFIKNGVVNTIGVEGAFGSYSFEQFHDFKDQESLKKISEAWLKISQLSAPSYIGLTESELNFDLWGIDNFHQYKENVEAYLESRKTSGREKEKLSRNRINLQSEIKKLPDSSLKKFLEIYSRYQEKELSLSSYVESLIEFTPGFDYTLHQFNESILLENKLNFANVQRERKIIFDRLLHKLSPNQVKFLMDVSNQYKNGMVSVGDYYREVESLAKEANFNRARYPNLTAYLQYIYLSESIDAKKLFRHISEAEEKIVERLAKTDRNKELSEKLKFHYLATKILDFQLTPDNWQAFQEFDRHESPLNLFDPVQFYELADKRSHSMIQNVLALKSTKPVIMISGGFHTNDLIAHLKKKKQSFLVLTPRLTKIETKAGSAYLTAFAQEQNQLKNFYQGEELFLSPAWLAIGNSQNPYSQPKTQKFAKEVGVNLSQHEIVEEPEYALSTWGVWVEILKKLDVSKPMERAALWMGWLGEGIVVLLAYYLLSSLKIDPNAIGQELAVGLAVLVLFAINHEDRVVFLKDQNIFSYRKVAGKKLYLDKNIAIQFVLGAIYYLPAFYALSGNPLYFPTLGIPPLDLTKSLVWAFGSHFLTSWWPIFYRLFILATVHEVPTVSKVRNDLKSPNIWVIRRALFQLGYLEKHQDFNYSTTNIIDFLRFQRVNIEVETKKEKLRRQISARMLGLFSVAKEERYETAVLNLATLIHYLEKLLEEKNNRASEDIEDLNHLISITQSVIAAWIKKVDPKSYDQIGQSIMEEDPDKVIPIIFDQYELIKKIDYQIIRERTQIWSTSYPVSRGVANPKVFVGATLVKKIFFVLKQVLFVPLVENIILWPSGLLWYFAALFWSDYFYLSIVMGFLGLFHSSRVDEIGLKYFHLNTEDETMRRLWFRLKQVSTISHPFVLMITGIPQGPIEIAAFILLPVFPTFYHVANQIAYFVLNAYPGLRNSWPFLNYGSKLMSFASPAEPSDANGSQEIDELAIEILTNSREGFNRLPERADMLAQRISPPAEPLIPFVEMERLKTKLLKLIGVLPEPGEGDVVAHFNGIDFLMFEQVSGVAADKRSVSWLVMEEVSNKLKTETHTGLDLKKIRDNIKKNQVVEDHEIAGYVSPPSINASLEEVEYLMQAIEARKVRPKVLVLKHSESYFLAQKSRVALAGVAGARAQYQTQLRRLILALEQKFPGIKIVVYAENSNHLSLPELMKDMGYEDKLKEKIGEKAHTMLYRAATAFSALLDAGADFRQVFGGMIYVYEKKKPNEKVLTQEFSASWFPYAWYRHHIGWWFELIASILLTIVIVAHVPVPIEITSPFVIALVPTAIFILGHPVFRTLSYVFQYLFFKSTGKLKPRLFSLGLNRHVFLIALGTWFGVGLVNTDDYYWGLAHVVAMVLTLWHFYTNWRIDADDALKILEPHQKELQDLATWMNHLGTFITEDNFSPLPKTIFKKIKNKNGYLADLSDPTKPKIFLDLTKLKTKKAIVEGWWEAANDWWEDRYKITQEPLMQTYPFNFQYSVSLSDAIKKYANPSGLKVLDLATGQGNFAMGLAMAGAKEVKAVDNSEQAVRMTQEVMESNDIDWVVKAEQQNIIDLTYDSGSFDQVVGSNFAYTILPRHRHKPLREAFRVLQRGGDLFLLEPMPNEDEVESRLSFVWEKTDWVEKLREAGFINIRINEDHGMYAIRASKPGTHPKIGLAFNREALDKIRPNDEFAAYQIDSLRKGPGENEDVGFIPMAQQAYVLGDGMSRPKGGHLASREGVGALVGYLSGALEGAETTKDILYRTETSLALSNVSIRTSNAELKADLIQKQGSKADLDPIGTTVVGAVPFQIKSDDDSIKRAAVVFGLGDSRIIRIPANGAPAEVLTDDDKVVNDIMRENQMSPVEAMDTAIRLRFDWWKLQYPNMDEDALKSKMRNHFRSALTKQLGQPNLEIEEHNLRVVELGIGDTLVAVTDGLYGNMTVNEIIEEIEKNPNPADHTSEIIKKAKANDRVQDDMSIISVKVTEEFGSNLVVKDSNQLSVHVPLPIAHQVGPTKNPREFNGYQGGLLLRTINSSLAIDPSETPVKVTNTENDTVTEDYLEDDKLDYFLGFAMDRVLVKKQEKLPLTVVRDDGNLTRSGRPMDRRQAPGIKRPDVFGDLLAIVDDENTLSMSDSWTYFDVVEYPEYEVSELVPKRTGVVDRIRRLKGFLAGTVPGYEVVDRGQGHRVFMESVTPLRSELENQLEGGTQEQVNKILDDYVELFITLLTRGIIMTEAGLNNFGITSDGMVIVTEIGALYKLEEIENEPQLYEDSLKKFVDTFGKDFPEQTQAYLVELQNRQRMATYEQFLELVDEEGDTDLFMHRIEWEPDLNRKQENSLGSFMLIPLWEPAAFFENPFFMVILGALAIWLVGYYIYDWYRKNKNLDTHRSIKDDIRDGLESPASRGVSQIGDKTSMIKNHYQNEIFRLQQLFPRSEEIDKKRTLKSRVLSGA